MNYQTNDGTTLWVSANPPTSSTFAAYDNLQYTKVNGVTRINDIEFINNSIDVHYIGESPTKEIVSNSYLPFTIELVALDDLGQMVIKNMYMNKSLAAIKLQRKDNTGNYFSVKALKLSRAKGSSGSIHGLSIELFISGQVFDF